MALPARDSSGRFIKATTTVSTVKSDIDPELEKPILSVTVTNPFKKILLWLDQIRKHQTTTFAVKLSIPLIAIPVIIGAAFSLGRISGVNLTKTNPSPSIMPRLSPEPQTQVSKAGTLKIAKSATQTTYLLSLRNGEIVILDVPDGFVLTKYANKQILVTGTYDKSVNTLRVTDIAEVAIYNSITLVEGSSSASPSP